MKHIPLKIEQYFAEPASRRFRSLENEKIISSLFDYLQQLKTVEEMLAITQLKRPAMEAIILNVEEKFPDYDLEFTMRHRQIFGSMIRFIMGFYGYFPGRAKPMKKGKFVRTAIVYYKK